VNTIRESGRPRTIYAALLLLFAICVLLTYLGLNLQRE
jgi:hypothetical protein